MKLTIASKSLKETLVSFRLLSYYHKEYFGRVVFGLRFSRS